MGETGSVEIDLQVVAQGPFGPAAEVLRLDGVAVDGPAAELAVHGVEVDPVSAGDESEGLLEVGPELLDRTRLAGVGSRHLEAAAGQAGILLFEAADVIPLPAVERQRDRL